MADAKYVKIPVWLMSIITVALLGVGSATYRKVDDIDKGLSQLKTALIAKQIIQPGTCQAPSKLPQFVRFQDNRTNAAIQNGTKQQ